MGLGHNDPWVESHMWPQQMWGQRSSRGQWPLVQVFAKTVTVSTYFDVCSDETRGSRTTCLKMLSMLMDQNPTLFRHFFWRACIQRDLSSEPPSSGGTCIWNLANVLRINTPTGEDLPQIFYTGSTNFKWNSPLDTHINCVCSRGGVNLKWSCSNCQSI